MPIVSADLFKGSGAGLYEIPGAKIAMPIVDATFTGNRVTNSTMNGLKLNGPLSFIDISPTSVGAHIALNKPASGYSSGMYGQASNGVDVIGSASGYARWGVILGDSSPESGSNNGSDFVVSRHADDGSFLSSPIVIKRSTGAITLNSATTINSTLTTSGSITVSSTGDAGMAVAANSTSNAAYFTFRQGGVQRGSITLRSSNSDMVFDRYNSSGTWLSSPIRIANTDGSVYLNENGGSTSISGSLTVGAGTSVASYIYMNDSDEGQRILHCNSNRIGFLTQAGGWGSWCNDDGGWQTAAYILAAGNISTPNTVEGGWVHSTGEVRAESNVRGSQFVSHQQAGLNMPTTYWDGGAYHQWCIQANPSYQLNFEALHIPSTQAGWRMWWGNGQIIDFKDNGHIYSGNGWSSASDIRIKTKIKHIDPNFALDALDGIRTITYERTDEKERVDGKKRVRYMGFAAQDWKKVAPEVVGTAGGSNPDMPDQLTLEYGNTVPFITAALKGLKAEVAKLKARIATLEAA